MDETSCPCVWTCPLLKFICYYYCYCHFGLDFSFGRLNNVSEFLSLSTIDIWWQFFVVRVVLCTVGYLADDPYPLETSSIPTCDIQNISRDIACCPMVGKTFPLWGNTALCGFIWASGEGYLLMFCKLKEMICACSLTI